jgi:DnaK suppressor protein
MFEKKEVLEKQLTDITAELQTIGIQDRETGDWEVKIDAEGLQEADENTEADAIESWHEERAVLAALETTYRNIKRALEKIETGTYGTCEICHSEITPARLDFLPTARTCTLHMDEEETLEL